MELELETWNQIDWMPFVICSDWNSVLNELENEIVKSMDCINLAIEILRES